MSDLIPTTALGGTTPRSVTHGALRLTENAVLGLASLALHRGGDAPAPFGLTLPAPGGWVQGEGVAAFWTGPDQWMIEGENRAEDNFAAELAKAAPGCSVTEQTDGWVVFEIKASLGAQPVEQLLQKLINIDLRDFGPGRAQRTGLEHLSVFVIRRAPGEVAVFGMRSAAETLWHALETAVKRLETKELT